MERERVIKLACAGLVAGTLSLTGCASGKAILSTGTPSEFQMECAKGDGRFSSHDCAGKNSCKGYEFQSGKGVSRHGCKGQSSCKGEACTD